MSTNKTQHYHLNQWEVEDKVLRAEFNQDNAKLDSALAQAAQERAGLCSQGGPDHDPERPDVQPQFLRLYVRRSGPPRPFCQPPISPVNFLPL